MSAKRVYQTPKATERRDAIMGLLYGAKEFIPERDIAIMLGDNPTDIHLELSRMEDDEIVERQAIPAPAFKAKQGSDRAWRLTKVV